jgi:hypothetical protein
MKKYYTWWDEFKESGWFERTLLVLPYLLATAFVGAFLTELFLGPL